MTLRSFFTDVILRRNQRGIPSMTEPESKDPKEESDQNETNSLSREDAGSPDENALEEQKPAPIGRSGLAG